VIAKGRVIQSAKGVITIVIDAGSECPELGDQVEVYVVKEPPTREETFVEGFMEGRQE
jgi:hypothetical protein